MRENKISDFTIHPNPAENFFVIESTAKTTYASVEIFDQLGRSLLRRNAVDFTKDNKVTLDISGLSSGMYYLRVEANGFTRSQEVVVSH
jgi:hypothetical protein